MKHLLFLLVPVMLSARLSPAQTTVLELPVNLRAGYGPFLPSMRGPFWQDELTDRTWVNTFSSLKNMPADWQDVKQGYIQLDENQFVYQHAKAGTLPTYMYDSYRKGLDWPRDTTTLSAQPIRCFVSIIAGKDAGGKPVAMLDTDGDLSFSGEQPIDLLPRPQQTRGNLSGAQLPNHSAD